MIAPTRILICCLLLAGATTATRAATPQTAAPSPSTLAAPRTDAHEADRADRLQRARSLISDGDPKAAIALIDGIITEYEREYPDGDTRWYVAQTLPETIAYTTLGAAAPDGKHHDTVVLDVAWAESYFLKAYALVELSAGSGAYKTNKGGNPQSDPQYLAQARATLERGLQLEPYHARMLSELGNILQVQQDWAAMLKVFESAETAASFLPEDEQDSVFGRAKRGVGYALTELGRLDEAEAKFRECLRIDPDDTGAKHELEYIRRLRDKR